MQTMTAKFQFGAAHRKGGEAPLSVEAVPCCICAVDDAEPVAVGEDFEYRTSPDSFVAVRCRQCGLVYLNLRPRSEELSRIYPPDYHAFEFSEEEFGFVYKVRRRLEARRLLRLCQGLGCDARLLDIGCGNGFHLGLLKEFGEPGWELEGVDPSSRAVQMGARKGLKIHFGTVQELDRPPASYDLALMIATIEHVDDPPGVLSAVRALLKPGGRVIIVTDNTDTFDFKVFKGRYWGGYHFPRHWNFFNPRAIRALARIAGVEVDSVTTIVSPVNWVYSIRNTLVDCGAPQWLTARFSRKSTLSLGAFTIFDLLHQWAGRGALLCAVLRRPV